MSLGGGKQGNEVTCRPRSPEGQGKHLNGAVCRFHTAPSLLILQEGYPQRRNTPKVHLWLAFGCEGGGGGRCIETTEKNHLQLALGCEGGGGGGGCIETAEKNHLRLVFGCEGGGGGGRVVGVVVVGFESPSLGWILLHWSLACRRHHRCCGLSSLLWVVTAAL